MTLSVYISSGTTPVFNDKLLMYEIGQAIPSAPSQLNSYVPIVKARSISGLDLAIIINRAKVNDFP